MTSRSVSNNTLLAISHSVEITVWRPQLCLQQRKYPGYGGLLRLHNTHYEGVRSYLGRRRDSSHWTSVHSFFYVDRTHSFVLQKLLPAATPQG